MLIIEFLTLVKVEAQRWPLSVPVFQSIKEAKPHASTKHVAQSRHSLENSVEASSLQCRSRGLSQHWKDWKPFCGVMSAKSAWMDLHSSVATTMSLFQSREWWANVEKNANYSLHSEELVECLGIIIFFKSTKLSKCVTSMKSNTNSFLSSAVSSFTY